VIKRFVKEEWGGLCWAIGIALVVLALEYWGWFASIEGRVQDLLLSAGITST
jgi:hypothetical protein